MKDKWWLSDPATWKGTWREDWRIMGQKGYLKDKKLQHMKFNRAMCTEDNDQCDFCYSLLDGDNQDASYAYFEQLQNLGFARDVTKILKIILIG